MSATDELLQANEAYAATFSGEELKAQIEQETGIRPPFDLDSFEDVEAGIRHSLARIHASPFITHKNARGSSSTSPRAGCKK